MLIGKNISLRPIELRDLNYLNKWKNTEEVFKYLGGGFFPVSIDVQSKWMDSLMDTTSGSMRFIIEKDKSNPIGFIGLYSVNNIHKTAEVGMYIGEIEEQGKGYATEAYNLFEDFIHKYINIRKIKLFVVNENTTAVKFWEKLGYDSVGVLKKERYINGKYLDVIIMEKFLKNGEDYIG